MASSTATWLGDDVDQRGQGRRDRRRAWPPPPDRHRERRRDRDGPDGPAYLSNHAGGILGGISTGQPVVVRFAVKPTSSILTPRASDHHRGRSRRDRHQGPPRPLRRHPRRAGGRGDDGLRDLLDHLLLDRGRRPAPFGPRDLDRIG
jgi:hypothetical protein